MIPSLLYSCRLLAQPVRKPLYVLPKALVSTTSVSRAGLIQELYLKELKAYKPPPVKAFDSDGHVQKFVPPKPPHPPYEGDIASELKEYENQQVEVEGQASAGESSEAEADWFEDDLEEEPRH